MTIVFFAFDLSGHTEGQLGILVNNKFFVADGCWYSNSYKKNLPPPCGLDCFWEITKEYLKP